MLFIDFEEGSDDENAYEVGKVRGRDDSDEDDYELDEGKKSWEIYLIFFVVEAESSEDDGPALPSRDDFGEKPASYYTDSAQPKKKKQKRNF